MISTSMFECKSCLQRHNVEANLREAVHYECKTRLRISDRDQRYRWKWRVASFVLRPRRLLKLCKRFFDVSTHRVLKREKASRKPSRKHWHLRKHFIFQACLHPSACWLVRSRRQARPYNRGSFAQKKSSERLSHKGSEKQSGRSAVILLMIPRMRLSTHEKMTK